MKIPSLPAPDDLPPITDAAALEQTWRLLMGELGFARPQLYVLFLDGGRPLFVSHLDDVPARPNPAEVREVARMFRQVTGVHEVGLAFLCCRPGSSALTPTDRTWGRALGPLSRWPVHVASDHDVVPVAPDDLAEAG